MKNTISLLLVLTCCLSAFPAFAQQAAADSDAAADQESEPTSSKCIPECRPGFVCVEQRCLSKCNPPCPEGETCTEMGKCVGAGQASGSASGTGRPLMMVSAQPRTDASMGPGDPGWGYEAFVLGLVGTAAIIGLTAGSAVTHGEPESAYLGLSALGLFAVLDPVLAFGGMSARSNVITRGYPVVRTFSWIGYGLTLAGGIGLGVSAIENDDVKPGLIASVGVLGVLSTVGFTVDAYASAEQAESPVGVLGAVRPSGPSWAPLLSVAPDRNGGLAASLGVGGRF
jgi:hypothetical protein